MRLITLLLSLLFSVPALADVQGYVMFWGTQYGNHTITYPDDYAAASAAFPDVTCTSSAPYRLASLVGTVAKISRCDDGWGAGVTYDGTYIRVSASCPAGQVLDDATGACNTPCNTTDTLSGAIPADQNPALLCSGSCEFEVQQASNTWVTSSDIGTIPAGSNVIVGSWIGTGNTCTASSVTPQNPSNNTCPSGQVNIGFGCQTYADNLAAIAAANALGSALQDPYGTPVAASAVSGTTTNASGVQSTITLDMSPLTTELTIIKNRLGTVHQDLGGDQPAYDPNQSTGDAIQAGANFSQDYQAVIDGIVGAESTDEASLLGWFSVDLPSNSCSPWVGSVHGFSFSFDWCPYTEMLRSLIGWLFALFGAWRIWNIIFGARS